MRFWFCILLLVVFPVILPAQKIALVLSGGGAKGLAHIGVLKALEEQNIPIDYVIGTSMGAVIGGLYAAGYSPNEIEKIAISDNFQDWVYGNVGKDLSYYFTRKKDNASWLNLDLTLDSISGTSIKSNLANDYAINFILAEYTAQASALAKYNFDSLLIPYRCMAADIFTQSQVILKDGNLSDAIRASMTVPFFYRPIKVNDQYLYDGGVYNNFPVDVAREEFNPDVVIGSNVSSKVFHDYPYEEDDKLLSQSLMFMLLDKSEPEVVGEDGIYIEPNLEDYTAFDFPKVKALIDSGYQVTQRKSAELQHKILKRREQKEVREIRNSYVKEFDSLLIDKVSISGYNDKQNSFVRKTFKRHRKKLELYEVKEKYYQLISEDYFNRIYPSIIYEPKSEAYQFLLTGSPKNKLEVQAGGNLATRSISELYLGFRFTHLNRFLYNHSLSFYTGRFYQSIYYSSQIRFSTETPIYIEPEFIFNSWDYLNSTDIVFEESDQTIINQIDRSLGINVGVAAGKKGKVVVKTSIFNNNDAFSNKEELVSTDTLDQLKLKGIKYGAEYSRNSLNRKQYASEGGYLALGLNLYHADETFLSGNTSLRALDVVNTHTWFKIYVENEQFFKLKHFTTGYQIQLVLSNQPFFSNYTGTLVNTPAYYPLRDSKTLFLENFRAFSYFAGGWKNIFPLMKNLDFRLEGYVFKPFQHIVEEGDQSPGFEDDFKKFFFAANATLVYHTPIGPAALNFNYYDDEQNQFGLFLHVGYLLFNKRSLD